MFEKKLGVETAEQSSKTVAIAAAFAFKSHVPGDKFIIYSQEQHGKKK